MSIAKTHIRQRGVFVAALTRMVHANNSHTSYSANHCIRSIAALLQQLHADVAADVTLRGHSAQFAMPDHWWCRIT